MKLFLLALCFCIFCTSCDKHPTRYGEPDVPAAPDTVVVCEDD